MATYTPNKKLELPTGPERYNIGVFNKNNTVIDSELHKLDLKNASQDSLLATKAEVEEKIRGETSRAVSEEQAINAAIAANKPVWDDKYTKNEIDNLFSMLETNIDWKESVPTFDDLIAAYPVPQDGWTVNVHDTDITYRYDGEKWISISANAVPKATDTLDGLLSKEDHVKYEDANAKKHLHDNKPVLDGITQDLVDGWNSAKTHADSAWNANTKNSPGYVAAGENHANKVWKTDGDGNPAWREEGGSLGGPKLFTTPESLGLDAATMTYMDLVNSMPENSVLICHLMSNTAFAPNSGHACILTVKCTGSASSKSLAFESVSTHGDNDCVYKARYAAPAETPWTGWTRATNEITHSDSEPVTLTKNMTWIGT